VSGEKARMALYFTGDNLVKIDDGKLLNSGSRLRRQAVEPAVSAAGQIDPEMDVLRV